MSAQTDFMASEHTIAANGLDIFYREVGSGAPLILLHGGTADSSSWQGFAEPFSTHFRVIALDTRGHGRTKNPNDTLNSYAQLADDTAAFCAALGLSKPLILGYSDGGQTALEIGMRHPGLAQALVLGGTVPRFADAYYANLKSWGFNGAGEVDFEKVAQSFGSDMISYLKTVHAPLGGEDYWQTLIRSISTLWLTPLNYSPADFQKIHAPTLILQGDRDDGLPVEMGAEMYRLIPNAELAIMPNADHGSTLAGWDGINTHAAAIVTDFFLRQLKNT